MPQGQAQNPLRISESANTTAPPKPKKFLDRLRDELRLRHYAWSTEKSYVAWVRRFILFHQKRHPQEMRAAEVRSFLEHLADFSGGQKLCRYLGTPPRRRPSG